jgi:membrane associated rhomboid family serine protease
MLPVRDHLPTRATPVVNYALIALNLAAFAYEVWFASSGGDLEAASRRWALVPEPFVAHPLAHLQALFSHMFVHGGLQHVAGNMLFLWIFGDNVEDVLGHFSYAVFYILCGVCAALAQVAMSPHSNVPMVGASGAIAGVLAAYAILYPRSPISVVNPIPLLWLFWGLFLSFPAWLVVAEFFIVNLWNAFQSSSAAGGVAFMAHVGGFLAGLALLPLLREYGPVEHDDWTGWRGPRRTSARA